MFPEELETERLLLERLSRDSISIPALYEICREEAPGIDEVTRHVTWEPYETPRDARQFVDHAETQWEEAEGIHYVVRPREGEDGAGEIAGMAGLGFDWDCDVAEPGVWLRKRFWGRGYSGERAAALLEVAFETLDIDVVRIPVHVDNDQSISAVSGYVERFGGRREGTVRNYHRLARTGPADMVIFSVSQAEYRTATA